MAPTPPAQLVVLGCGYVGGALARTALDRGIAVTALTRNAARARALSDAGARVVVADLASSDWHDQMPVEVDWVADTVSAADASLEGYRRSYVDGMRSILAWAGRRERPIATLCYTSSTGVYPQGGGGVVDESASTAGGGPTGGVLVEAEEILRAAPPSAVARWFILRLAGIYGPQRHALWDKLRSGAAELPGEADFPLNLVHRDDVVTALMAAFTAPASVGGGTFNVSDDAPATRAEVAAWLAARLDRPPPSFSGPASSGRKGGAPAPTRIIRSRRIREVLGWRPAHADFRAGYDAILGGQI